MNIREMTSADAGRLFELAGLVGWNQTQEDCAFLLSAKGRQAIIDLHIDGIIAYLNEEEPKPFR